MTCDGISSGRTRVAFYYCQNDINEDSSGLAPLQDSSTRTGDSSVVFVANPEAKEPLLGAAEPGSTTAASHRLVAP